MRALIPALGLTVLGVAGWAGLALFSDQVLVGSILGVALLLVSQGLLVSRLRGSRSSVTDQRMSQEAERGRRLAIYNPSTGLLAQWYFELRVEEETARAKRYGLPLVILTVTGSAAGGSSEANPFGRTANESSSIANQAVRRTDLVGSIGFSEFAICLVHCDRAGAVPVIRRLMDSLGEGDWRLGIAVFPDDECTGKELIQLATRRSAPWKINRPQAKAA
jgi:GGDEF domain-containing protein